MYGSEPILVKVEFTDNRIQLHQKLFNCGKAKENQAQQWEETRQIT